MEIRSLKLESKLFSIGEDLKKQGYQVEEYTTLENLRRDGLRITKQGIDYSRMNLLESKWLCGVIIDFEGNLVLNLREETPHSKELFNIAKHYFEY